VVVVDSLSSGAIEAAIRENGWPVEFFNAETNLGAAGNHHKRLELASAHDADWCYTVNADGEIVLETVARLVAAAEGQARVGAVYPARVFTNRGNSWDSGQRSLVPLPLIGRDAPPEQAVDELTWASSNGALYSLAPVRAGVQVWTDLWHGWEDLAYGWTLHRNGWRQLRCRDAVYRDTMEYRQVRLPGFSLYITDKPSWYAYYVARNLILVSRRSGQGVTGLLVVLARVAQEVVVTLLFRREKLRRLRLLALGTLDGIRGIGGRGPVP